MEDELWKKPESTDTAKVEPALGIWSRSRPFRIVLWVIVLLAMVPIALVVSAYLSGFNSVFEMFTWIAGNVTG
jgi:hypothetical protein